VFFAVIATLATATGPLYAQVPADTTRQEAASDTTPVYAVDPVIVTATRTPRPVFLAPMPVQAITPQYLKEQVPNTVSDLFRGMTGLDVSGVGANQVRPIIRGQRGQRVLLLADGVRLNNSRRQQDFGELPALVDVSSVERVEVVRGPASVLYGSDAIGGVVNIITEPPQRDGLMGTLGYRYGSEADQHRGTARVFGGFERWDLAVGASWRDAGWYSAPAGSFGNITLAEETQVQNTGVQDRSIDARLGYRFTSRHRVFGKFERYEADEAGFGFVDPEAYAPDEASIEILYPFQDFTKFSLGYSGTQLNSVLADRFDAVGYVQQNKRRLDFNLFTLFGPGTPPGAGIAIETENFTDIGTTGFRLEATKLAASPLLLTYGVDFFRDDSENTDVSNQTVVGFGPPMTETDSTPTLPNATYRAIGVFLQGELAIGPRATVILGGRYQDIRAESRETVGLDNEPETDTNRTFVGALNAIYEVTEGLSLVGTLGRGFRAPNLIELFFEGRTPEGGGYQKRNTDLKAEKSVNVDLGLRYRNQWVSAEGFVFRNQIDDGIRIAPLDEEVDGFPAFTNVNVAELLFTGVEISADFFLPSGFTVGGNFSTLSSEDRLDPDNPIGESYSTKFTWRGRWDEAGDRFFVEYAGRHNGEQKEAQLVENPIGDVLPAFTVHDVRAGLTFLRTADGRPQRVVLGLQNITDELYAEFSNASFFRPEPGRRVTLGLELAF
jgi:hemoglobin/transferrin/lactoferrin receptor protein